VPSIAAPSTGGGTPYRQPSEPFAASTVRPPATIPLALPERPNGSLVFVKGCWRTDNFAYAQHRGTITWCFDDRGGGRYLYTRTDQPNVFFCIPRLRATWNAGALELRGVKPACDDGSTDAPAELTCRDGTDGALCTGSGQSWTVRLYRVRLGELLVQELERLGCEGAHVGDAVVRAGAQRAGDLALGADHGDAGVAGGIAVGIARSGPRRRSRRGPRWC
jgi:hypothetical protein